MGGANSTNGWRNIGDGRAANGRTKKIGKGRAANGRTRMIGKGRAAIGRNANTGDGRGKVRWHIWQKRINKPVRKLT